MDSVGLLTDRGVFKNLLKMGAKNKEVEKMHKINRFNLFIRCKRKPITRLLYF